jgi:uncharacterized SAM-binding protein YcdF (DUF218 family)
MAMVKPAPIDSTPPRRRSLVAALRLAAFAGIAAAALFAGGFGLFATHVSELEAPADIAPADAIIVLTGGQSRIDTALALLKSGKGKRLLISGVHPSASQEALRVANGGDRALFSCCVDIDYAALDTIGNADESAKWVRDNHFDSVIVVTNNYHMPRSLLEMRRSLWQATLEPYPVVNTQLRHGGWLTRPDALRVIFMEYAKFLAAAVRIAVTPAALDMTAGAPPEPERSAGLK